MCPLYLLFEIKIEYFLGSKENVKVRCEKLSVKNSAISYLGNSQTEMVHFKLNRIFVIERCVGPALDICGKRWD